MDHVVMFSGGVGSWAAAKRVVEKNGPEGVTLLFADTLIEDEDLYRFLDEAAANVGATLVRLAEGRTPWEDVRFVGNTRVDPCSRILKRDLLRSYIESNFDPATTVVYLGIDWTEIHRFERARNYWLPWTVEAPLCDPPYIAKPDLLLSLIASGVAPPRLYGMGFPHNNCGGFCVKAGQAHFANLHAKLPDRYAAHEKAEADLRDHLGKDVAILRDRRGGKTRPYTLRQFRKERLEGSLQYDAFDWGGCGCFID